MVQQVVTNENGETEIITQIVEIAPADTNTGNVSASNGGSHTGDIAVVAAAVMAIAAIGVTVCVKRKEH